MELLTASLKIEGHFLGLKSVNYFGFYFGVCVCVCNGLKVPCQTLCDSIFHINSRQIPAVIKQ